MIVKNKKKKLKILKIFNICTKLNSISCNG